jgi:hypothetical protein
VEDFAEDSKGRLDDLARRVLRYTESLSNIRTLVSRMLDF